MRRLTLILLSLFLACSLQAQRDLGYRAWQKIVYDRPDSWYGSAEAIRIAENVLLYQREIGGWPKNTPMHQMLSKEEKRKLKELQSAGDGATTDNGATISELTYLSKVYKATGKEEYKAAFLKGIRYLLDAQYPNGGWPQFYPLREDYSRHITYNDGSMVNILRVMKIISEQSETLLTVEDEEIVQRAAEAYTKGIEVILKTQIRQNGVLTVWCAQHDEVTLEPVGARTYELPSLSGKESAGIVMFLMEIEDPSPEVVQAVEAAVHWFAKTKMQGIRVEFYQTEQDLMDKRVVEDADAPALWARFSDLKDNQPFFCDRDGLKKYRLDEIGHERRMGYGWYTDAPQEVLDRYQEWKSRNL
jgi:pectinesterase